MKQPNRLWTRSIFAIACAVAPIVCFHAEPVYAQQNTGTYDDGTFYITATIDLDSNFNLYASSYMEVEFDDYEDIDAIEVDGTADEDGTPIASDSADGDDDDPAGFTLQSNAPVAAGHEYGMESDGYACYDDGEGDCDPEYVGSASASVNGAIPPPHINSISPTSVDEGDRNTLTINGSYLVQGTGDQLTINYSGSGMPFTLTDTPSATAASFSYDFSGYSPGSYTLSVTNNEATSNSVNFTVNPPVNACSQSTTPNSVTLQVAGITSGSQAGSFTISHPTVAASSATTTVSYGPFSTPSSVASSIASAIVSKYVQFGLTAQANGPSITLQSRSNFQSVTSSSSGGGFGTSIGVPSSVSCVVLPTLPCLGFAPNYDKVIPYRKEGISETAREHIIRRHISNVPSVGTDVYVSDGLPADYVFGIVQKYNLHTYLLSPGISGVYTYTFPKRTIGGVEFGVIGTNVSGADLYTNKFVLSSDRCTAITSYPITP